MKVLRSEARPRANFELWQYKLIVVLTAASLEFDSGWIPRQCEYIVFLRKFSVRAIVVNSYKIVSFVEEFERMLVAGVSMPLPEKA